jgi:hypothetical protein
MRCALHAQHQDIVGVAGGARWFVVESDAVGTAVQHHMDGIEATTEQSGLRAAAVERNAE